MFVPFVTIEGNSNEGWDVVEKSFPAQSAYTFAKRILQHSSYQKEAEAEACQIARAFNLTFIPENANVVLVAPHFGFYMAKLITPEGEVKELGTKTQEIEKAILEAKSHAEEGQRIFLMPRPIVFNVSQ